ncbi:hypothetical protein PMAYCL1PPCAC_19201, partial [Pristionchus mayeri]
HVQKKNHCLRGMMTFVLRVVGDLFLGHLEKGVDERIGDHRSLVQVLIPTQLAHESKGGVECLTTQLIVALLEKDVHDEILQTTYVRLILGDQLGRSSRDELEGDLLLHVGGVILADELHEISPLLAHF